jgi:aminoglycoside/choline kinase family phosphotransferase
VSDHKRLGGGRKAACTAFVLSCPARSKAVLEETIRPYIERITGRPQVAYDVVKMVGDASSREYFRVKAGDGVQPQTLVVMSFNPSSAFKSDEAATEAATVFPFTNVQGYLRNGGLPVPAVYEQELAKGLVFLEDLGDVQLYSKVHGTDDRTQVVWYKRAIDLLLDFQQYSMAGNPDQCIGFTRRFDGELLMWEFEHYLEFGIEALYDVRLPDLDREYFRRVFAKICDELVSIPQVLAHRDFQSRNLMVTDGRLTLIDFQDALIGPLPYDLVALLRDSYVSLSHQVVDELIAYYLMRREERFGDALDARQFERWFWLQTLQRKLKDAGRFVFIDRVKHNDWFLQHIPNSLAYVAHALNRLPEFSLLAERLGRYDERVLA